MTNAQREALLDAQGFLKYALEREWDFIYILSWIEPDLRTLLSNAVQGLDEPFEPRTKGYAQYLDEGGSSASL